MQLGLSIFFRSLTNIAFNRVKAPCEDNTCQSKQTSTKQNLWRRPASVTLGCSTNVLNKQCSSEAAWTDTVGLLWHRGKRQSVRHAVPFITTGEILHLKMASFMYRYSHIGIVFQWFSKRSEAKDSPPWRFFCLLHHNGYYLCWTRMFSEVPGSRGIGV